MSKHRRRPVARPLAYRGHLAAAGALIAGGMAALGVAAASQQHAPQPTAAQAGTVGPASATAEPTASARATPSPAPSHPAPGVHGLTRSDPVSIDIPAIGVRSGLLTVGLNADGTIQVPPLYQQPSEAAWFDDSPTPGEPGSSVIEGHVDTHNGPSVFFRLGALRPGDDIDVTLADGTVAVFRVTGVRRYPKDDFPTLTVYGDTGYPSLRLITCGGAFDSASGHYLSNIVVFATLTSHH